MSTNFTHSYVRELESLVLDQLFPIYELYYKERGLEVPYQRLPRDLVQEIKRKHTLPALLKPKASENE